MPLKETFTKQENTQSTINYAHLRLASFTTKRNRRVTIPRLLCLRNQQYSGHKLSGSGAARSADPLQCTGESQEYYLTTFPNTVIRVMSTFSFNTNQNAGFWQKIQGMLLPNPRGGWGPPPPAPSSVPAQAFWLPNIFDAPPPLPKVRGPLNASGWNCVCVSVCVWRWRGDILRLNA